MGSEKGQFACVDKRLAVFVDQSTREQAAVVRVRRWSQSLPVLFKQLLRPRPRLALSDGEMVAHVDLAKAMD